MPLSQIWTLQAAAGGDEKTLTEWGFSSAARSSAIQGDDTVTLGYAPDDAISTPDLFPWETEIIIRRAGQVYYRGYVASAARSSSAGSDAITYTLRSQWWVLSRLTYRQTWPALTGGSMGTVQTGRARLGIGTGGTTIAAMFGDLAAYAATMGVTLTVDLSELPTRMIPPVEGSNRSVADLIRDIMRWFPDTALVPVYSESGTTYVARLSSSDPVQVIDIAGAPLSALDIAPLYERQVDAVQVIYEATATESRWDDSIVEGEGGFSSVPRLAAPADTFPVGASITRRSLVLTLPYPSPPAGQGAADSGSQATPPTQQPIVSKTWPPTGATDVDAQQWWLDRSSLGALGLVAADVMLPFTSDKTTIQHRVVIDPAEIEMPPSAVNPNSTPVWKPATATETPRELISGGLADWMPGRIKAYSLIAEVTVAVKKSAVTAMSDANKAAFLRLGPREKTISSIPAYLLDCLYKFTGTNALTKVYTQRVAPNPDGIGSSAGAGESTEISYEEAKALAVIPGLAANLFAALSPLHYQGSAPLVFLDPPLASFLGRRIALNHPDRPEWLDMAAQASQETVDIGTGKVGITFGPPAHLGAQDYANLHTAARTTQARRAESAAAPKAVANPSTQAEDEADDEPPRNAIVGSSVLPKSQFQWQSGGTGDLRPWDIVAEGTATFRLWSPKVIWKREDVQSSVALANTAFTPAADKYLVAKIDSITTPTISVELLSGNWPDFPQAYEFEGDDNDFVSARLPLWHFTGEESEGANEIAEGVWAKKLVPSDVLRLVFPLYQIPTTTVLRSVPDLV